MKNYFIFALFFLLVIVALLIVNQQLIQNSITDNKEKETTLIGSYSSVKGVMDQLSCYCFNAGYLTRQDDKIPICFQNDENIECDKIQAIGFYKNKKISTQLDNPCPSGEMKLFYVSSYECR